ncbi:MAG: ribonuclease J [Metamycoplasmataceae bacterium]
MSLINFFALGGLDENGKNCYILEIDNDLFIINYGKKVPISSTNGIDTLIADYTFIEKNAHRVKGVFITNIDNDNLAGLPWLIMQVRGLKIYSSSFSNFVINNRLEKYNIEHDDYEVLGINPKGLTIGSVFIKPYILASAVPGNLGLQFNTNDGNILFLSNFVVGELGIFGNTNLDFIKKNNENLLALIIDSGASNFNGRSIDHIDLTNSLEETFSKSNDDERIIVGVYDNDIYSAFQIITLAKKYNRKIIPYGKTFNQLIDLIISTNEEISFPPILYYKEIEKQEKVVVLISGMIERLYKRFLRITEGEDIYIKLRNNDHVIMIAPPINGLEAQSAFMLDEIARITPNIYDFSSLEHYNYRPAKQDIIDISTLLKPKYLFPIQGLYRHMITTQREVIKTGKNIASIPILKNGKVAKIENGQLISQNEMMKNIGDIIIDGFGVGDISSEVIFERETLARDGVIIISIITDKNYKKLYNNIDIKYIGVIPSENRPKIDEIIKKLIISKFFSTEGKNKSKELNNNLKKLIKKLIFKITSKEPFVIVLFSEI